MVLKQRRQMPEKSGLFGTVHKLLPVYYKAQMRGLAYDSVAFAGLYLECKFASLYGSQHRSGRHRSPYRRGF